jgi:hypothetical protein
MIRIRGCWTIPFCSVSRRSSRDHTPFKSQAQRRKFAQLLVEGKISNQTFEEWNRETATREEDDRSMSGGSNEDRTRHSGSRDVTEGSTGGAGTETGGTRN